MNDRPAGQDDLIADPIVVTGPPGGGKTTLVSALAARTG
ncbi:MAG: AAA family ATPase [Acidimicrobiales bacterium]